MKILRERKHYQGVVYWMEFLWPCGLGGFTFPCDQHGNVHDNELTPEGRQNLRKCLSGEMVDVTYQGVRASTYDYWGARVGQCVCGQEVALVDFTNTCICGRDYNTSGCILAPRDQWGEETGEHWSDCY